MSDININWKAILAEKMLEKGVSPKVTAELVIHAEVLLDSRLSWLEGEVGKSSMSVCHHGNTYGSAGSFCDCAVEKNTYQSMMSNTSSPD